MKERNKEELIALRNEVEAKIDNLINKFNSNLEYYSENMDEALKLEEKIFSATDEQIAIEAKL